MLSNFFITELETLTNNVIHHTILYPSYKNIVDSLSGISMGVGSRNSHMPAATRVEYVYLGKQINIREVLGNCGLFKLNTKLVDSNIIAILVLQQLYYVRRDGSHMNFLSMQD